MITKATTELTPINRLYAYTLKFARFFHPIEIRNPIWKADFKCLTDYMATNGIVLPTNEEFYRLHIETNIPMIRLKNCFGIFILKPEHRENEQLRPYCRRYKYCGD